MSSITEIGAAEGTEQDTVLPAKSTLSVIMPAYNEVATVAEILRRVLLQPLVSEIVFVDDGSNDGTWEAVQHFSESLSQFDRDRLVLLQHDKNRGKGRAIRTALDKVSGTHVLIQDADLEYDPADIPKLWRVMLSGTADAVYGSRYLQDSRLQKGRWVMQSGVRLLNFLVQVLYRVKLTDEATCYKMFRTADLRAINLRCERFEFCPEVTAKSLRSGWEIAEVPIKYSARSTGKKLRISDAFPAFMALFRTKFEDVSMQSERRAAGDGLGISTTVLAVPQSSLSNARQRNGSSIAKAHRFTIILATSFLVIWLSAHVVFGSLSAARAWLSGAPVFASTPVIDLGRIDGGGPQRVVLSVQNLSSSTITVIGAKTDCRCTVAAGLPLEVEPLATESFEVTLTPPVSDAGTDITKSVSLFLNADSPPVIYRIRAAVRGSTAKHR